MAITEIRNDRRLQTETGNRNGMEIRLGSGNENPERKCKYEMESVIGNDNGKLHNNLENLWAWSSKVDSRGDGAGKSALANYRS